MVVIDIESIEKETGLKIEREILEKIDRYFNILLQYNRSCNLTRITEGREILYKHLIDSLHLFRNIKLNLKNRPESIIDIGTGGGIPGVILAILDDWEISLIETIGKKCKFLQLVAKSLGLNNLTIINERVEEYGRKNREKFNLAISRAFSSISYCMETHFPLVKIMGNIILMEGPNIEITEDLRDAAILLGGNLKEVIEYQLGDFGERKLIIFSKDSNTETRFPRTNAAMKKRPLFK
jgi:16S rRNA (guanine527-N7)-methyltransferase